jgi:hypothetical protein
VVSAVSLTNQDRLASQGFAIESGNWFTDQSVELYTHRDLGHRKVGDVALSVHVQNTRSLNNYESMQFARKAEFGFFPWKPGKDCMAREFTKVSRVPRPGGGFQNVRGEKVMGCKWCRASNLGQQGAVTDHAVQVEPLPPAAVTPPAAAPAPIKCGLCDFTTIKGEASLLAHFSHKHSGTRKSRTRKGAGRRT